MTVHRLSQFPPLRVIFRAYYHFGIFIHSRVLLLTKGVDSVLVKGSAATGTLQPGLSDVDLLILLHPGSPRQVLAAMKRICFADKLLRVAFPFFFRPLFFTREEWTRVSDTLVFTVSDEHCRDLNDRSKPAQRVQPKDRNLHYKKALELFFHLQSFHFETASCCFINRYIYEKDFSKMLTELGRFKMVTQSPEVLDSLGAALCDLHCSQVFSSPEEWRLTLSGRGRPLPTEIREAREQFRQQLQQTSIDSAVLEDIKLLRPRVGSGSFETFLLLKATSTSSQVNSFLAEVGTIVRTLRNASDQSLTVLLRTIRVLTPEILQHFLYLSPEYIWSYIEHLPSDCQITARVRPSYLRSKLDYLPYLLRSALRKEQRHVLLEFAHSARTASLITAMLTASEKTPRVEDWHRAESLPKDLLAYERRADELFAQDLLPDQKLVDEMFCVTHDYIDSTLQFAAHTSRN